MTWQDVFMHWPVEPDRVPTTLPDGLESTRTTGGMAPCGPVPMADIDRAAVRRAVLRRAKPPDLRGRRRDARGYFDNLDADDRLSVTLARQLFQLSYYQASMQVRTDGDSVEFRSRRTSSRAPPADFHATYEPTEPPSTPEPGSVESFRWSGTASMPRATTGRCTTPTSTTSRGRFSAGRQIFGRTACSPRRGSTGPTATARSLLRRDTGDCGAAPPADGVDPTL